MVHHLSFDIEFKKNPYPGKFISFEGIDGSGKSLQLENIQKYFQKEKKNVVVIRESKTPGPVGDLIRKVLYQEIIINPSTFQHLYVAQRAMLYEQTIIPALQAGKIVLSDRCFWSAIPYGLSDTLSTEEVENLKKVSLVAYSILSFYHQCILPDITFYVNIFVDTAIARLTKMGRVLDMYEKEERLNKISALYQWLLDTFPKAFTVIDGNRPPEEVTEEILERVVRSL